MGLPHSFTGYKNSAEKKKEDPHSEGVLMFKFVRVVAYGYQNCEKQM